MTSPRSPVFAVRVRGPLACFTRPELKVERMSYPVMTPSAARGVLTAVLWKPAIAWRIHRIRVLREIRFVEFRRNEVNSKAVAPAAAIVNQGGEPPVLLVDHDRAQRNTVALREVDYVIEASFSLTDQAGPSDNLRKFIEIFERRLEKGQHFYQPYLGCREFAADVLSAEGAPPPIEQTRDLGVMLWDIDFQPKKNTPIFFRARLERGVLEVPEDPQSTFDDAGKEVA